jgi:uncharacterized protein DUF4157
MYENKTKMPEQKTAKDFSESKQEKDGVVASAPHHSIANIQRKANNTGLPDNLKSGIEQLSGHSMDDVKVHFNSSKPAQLQAHAYTQGTAIHVGSGQEKHLPHEAWHVVQQKQGRVRPTMQMKGKVNVNEDVGLEREADVMGREALSVRHGGLPKIENIKQSSPVSNDNYQTQLGSSTAIQRKHRIDFDKVDPEKREEIQKEIEKLKAKRRSEKKAKTSTWAASPGKDEARDEVYNTDIEQIRKEYEEGVKTLAQKHGVEKTALISGDAYYGEQVSEDGAIFHRRSDNGKEYVKDERGTFVPRYIRRELNHQDDLAGGITTQGISDYSDLQSRRQTGPGGVGALSWEHREFLQQSIGGGSNLFALSHTSTKRPILSNAHDSFGQKPASFDHSGATITDLTKMGGKKFSAQWTLDPVTGHKKMLPEGVHQTLDWKSKKDSGKERDKTVRRSGYRNMEVVAEGVPKEAIIQPDTSWHTAEGPQTDYHSGQSKRGQAMVEFRTGKQKEVQELARSRQYWAETLGRMYGWSGRTVKEFAKSEEARQHALEERKSRDKPTPSYIS